MTQSHFIVCPCLLHLLWMWIPTENSSEEQNPLAMLQQVPSAMWYNSLGSLEKCISSKNSLQVQFHMRVGFSVENKIYALHSSSRNSIGVYRFQWVKKLNKKPYDRWFLYRYWRLFGLLIFFLTLRMGLTQSQASCYSFLDRYSYEKYKCW